MVLQVLTANRLGDGRVVFLDGEGGWSDRIADARIAADEEAAAALVAAGARAERARLVVGPYLIEVTEGEEGPWPVRLREAIRAAGPSVAAPDDLRPALEG